MDKFVISILGCGLGGLANVKVTNSKGPFISKTSCPVSTSLTFKLQFIETNEEMINRRRSGIDFIYVPLHPLSSSIIRNS